MSDFFTMKHPPYPLFIKRLKSCDLKLLKVSFQIWCCWKPVFAGFETSLKFKETIFIQNYKKNICCLFWPAFGVPSDKTLFKIYNIYFTFEAWISLRSHLTLKENWLNYFFNQNVLRCIHAHKAEAPVLNSLVFDLTVPLLIDLQIVSILVLHKKSWSLHF